MEIISYILLLVYSLGLSFLVYKSSFFSSSILSKKNISILLAIKICFGVLYIFINKYFVLGGDIFLYFEDANIIFTQLKTDPISYLKLIFAPNNQSLPKDLNHPIYEMGFWQDTGAYMVVRFNAIIRLISLGNIYIHGVFAAFFSFIGCFLIAKVFEYNVKAHKFVLFSLFIAPSLLFWTSGIHKEFISVFALGLILYHFFELSKRINQPLNILFFIIGLVLFFFTRNYMLLALIPSLLAFFLHKAFHVRFKRAVFFSLIVFIGFLTYQNIPGYNKTGFEVILEKRLQFEDLSQGTTSIELDKIEPTFISLMSNAPKALFNTIARPHFLEVQNTFILLASLESFLLLLLIFFAFINFHRLSFKESNFVVFMLMYSVSLLLIIGWVVPNIGAILRYRSIALIILIPTLLFVIGKNKKVLKALKKFNVT